MREKFRAHYIWSGNASESARDVGIPESTGRDIARAISQEESFIEARAALRERALGDLVAMRTRIAERACDRALSVGADEYPSGDGVHVIDKRPEWAKVLLDCEKNAHALAKMTSFEDSKPAVVNVTISGPGDGQGS